MLFSEYYNVKRTTADDWFDPVMNLDTHLFIDPFLIFESGHPFFENSYSSIMRFFEDAYELCAASGGNPKSPQWSVLLNMFLLHEVSEICLGYTRYSTGGSGWGPVLAAKMRNAVAFAVAAGLQDLKHFEHVALFEDSFGPDRISDMTANLIRPELISYTQEVCRRHNVPTKPYKLPLGKYSSRFKRWGLITVELPENPSNTKEGIILVPSAFLDALPEIGHNSFQRFVLSNEGLRSQLNLEISATLRVPDIIEIARKYPEWVRQYVLEIERSGSRLSYDFNMDRLGLYRWYEASRDFALANPISVDVKDEASLDVVVVQMIKAYKHFVEDQGGQKLLWDGDRDKSEEAAQLLLMGIVTAYCKANDIDVTREADVGRGSVDFKFSQGFEKRIVVELKKANNSRWRDGITTQLPIYVHSEGVDAGLFVLLVYREIDVKRADEAKKLLRETAKTLGMKLYLMVVDARPKVSASKAKMP